MDCSDTKKGVSEAHFEHDTAESKSAEKMGQTWETDESAFSSDRAWTTTPYISIKSNRAAPQVSLFSFYCETVSSTYLCGTSEQALLPLQVEVGVTTGHHDRPEQ